MKWIDNQLVYLYRYENSIESKNILYEKYYQTLMSYTRRLVKTTFFYLSVDLEDVTALCYKNFIHSLNTYDYTQGKYNFAQALFIVNRSCINAYCKSLFNNKHKMMYSALSVDKNNDFVDSLKCFADENNPETFFIKSDSKENNRNIINQILKDEPDLVKKTILLRADGYRNKDIAKILKKPVKKIANTFNNFVRKAKQEYSEKLKDYYY